MSDHELEYREKSDSKLNQLMTWVCQNIEPGLVVWIGQAENGGLWHCLYMDRKEE